MAVVVTANITTSINWSAVDTSNVTIISNLGSIELNQDLSSGSGNLQTNMVWIGSGVLGAGNTQKIDLGALTMPLFNSTITYDLVGGKLKAIQFLNLTNRQHPGANYVVSATGTNSFTDLFG